MTSLWALFVLLQAAGVGFGLLSIWRVRNYIKRYKFDESKYTLLFGFIHLYWILVIYAMIMFIWVAANYYIFTLL